ncbi:MAG TPA: hypothetical protein VHB02_11890 [Acidimicrobiales bacterium]|nr:hypothetical protein [Acidimicrobiales bacterium]
MAGTARPVHVGLGDRGEVRVPEDVAALVQAAGAMPLDDPRRLRHATTPLTADERAALTAFLAE